MSIVAAAFTGGTLLTQREALHANEKAVAETQRTTAFLQFQQQYDSVRDDFPHQYMDPGFRPASGSEEYARLQAYWYFCFSEWYATHRVNPAALGSLWTEYYSPLIADGLKIRSLRHVLEDRIRARGVGGGDWTAYLRELAQIARRHGEPLAKDVEARIQDAEAAELDTNDVRFASTQNEKASQ